MWATRMVRRSLRSSPGAFREQVRRSLTGVRKPRRLELIHPCGVHPAVGSGLTHQAAQAPRRWINYSSDAGAGPYGYGWSLSGAYIERPTRKRDQFWLVRDGSRRLLSAPTESNPGEREFRTR